MVKAVKENLSLYEKELKGGSASTGKPNTIDDEKWKDKQEDD